ncbi:condensation domain-containing protein [Streptomyces sp. NRRL F-2747]|uniref:condensation domain-containing protein n=1 Tax=Streptomyces sp. NRRL F-2747 TaxID=1463843 RepID=UPI000689C9CB|nr:condensation domain-containing protein [Streptomyces sp. NRRL F-2747]
MDGTMTVVIAPGSPLALDLLGPLDALLLASALDMAAPCEPTLSRHTATHHTLRLTCRTGERPGLAGRLADLLTDPAAGHGRPGRRSGVPAALPRLSPPGRAEHQAGAAAGLPASARQREVLLDAMAAPPGPPLHLGQLHLRWYGPLDRHRFDDAWQAVCDRESVLRAAFAPGPGRGGSGPVVTVHERAELHVRHDPYEPGDAAGDAAAWAALLRAEREQPFDLGVPGPLRVRCVEGAAGAHAPDARIVLTYHQALLDAPSAHMLLRAFLRAYAADSRVAGGERRPGLPDHLRWLGARDQGPARAFWTRAAPPAGARTLPAVAPVAGAGPAPAPGPAAAPARGGEGYGRAVERLNPTEAVRLRGWAASCGVAESTALHAAWALQLHRAASPGAADGSVPVAFGVSVSGRGIPLEGADRLPGPLRNPLPLSVDVDPAAPLARLLTDLRDRALGLAAYEWVSAGQIREQVREQIPEQGGAPGQPPQTESLITFERVPVRPGAAGVGDPLDAELAAAEVRVGPAEDVEAHTGLPLVLTARHDRAGGLVLTADSDRARLADADAARILEQTVLLLRELPEADLHRATVADALTLLEGLPRPGAVAAPRTAAPRLVTLRPAAYPGAGTVLLVPPPDAPEQCYEAVARAHRGLQALVTLDAPADATACLVALRPVLAAGGPLLLGCFSGGGAIAYEVAERIGAHGWRAPLVSIGGSADGGTASAQDLSRALWAAARHES